MKDAKGHGSDSRGGDAAHQQGVAEIGQESPKSQGLRLFADNDADLHRQSFKPVMDNLAKKADKGVYDPAKATKLWGYHADRAAQAMHKSSGAPGAWHQAFPTSVRREAASHWERANRR